MIPSMLASYVVSYLMIFHFGNAASLFEPPEKQVSASLIISLSDHEKRTSPSGTTTQNPLLLRTRLPNTGFRLTLERVSPVPIDPGSPVKVKRIDPKSLDSLMASVRGAAMIHQLYPTVHPWDNPETKPKPYYKKSLPPLSLRLDRKANRSLGLADLRAIIFGIWDGIRSIGYETPIIKIYSIQSDEYGYQTDRLLLDGSLQEETQELAH